MPIVHTNLGIAEPSTITAELASVQIVRNSSNEQQEILCLGDPESSLGIARVVDAAPDSTHFGAVVRQVGYVAPSTITTVSTGSVRVHQSTAADLLATVTPAAGSTFNVRPLQSSQADLRATVYQSTAANLQVTATQNSTAWVTQARLTTSTGGAVEGSTASPSSQALGVHVRPVHPPRRSVYSTFVSTASTAFYPVFSSGATKHVVKGYSLTSTAVTPLVVTFHSGTNAAVWHSAVGSGSSGMTGANLIDPSGLFETALGEALTIRLSSTGVEVSLSVAAFPEA